MCFNASIMFIQTEATPNPQTLKFIPGSVLSDQGVVDFPSPETAMRSPLALRLFAIEGVKGVMIGADFVTVTKDAALEWDILKPSLLAALMEHLVAKRPILSANTDQTPLESEPVDHKPEDEGIVKDIQALLDTKIRPAVAMDGGDITFAKYEDGVVYLRMKGSCSGCPSSTATLKSGIENMLRYYVPEVQEVRNING
jgi:Fe-S cluster biogenesis protein NfuA